MKLALAAALLPLAADAFAPSSVPRFGVSAGSKQVSLRSQAPLARPMSSRVMGGLRMTLASEPVTEKAGEIRDLAKADCNPNFGETGGAMLVMEDVTVQRCVSWNDPQFATAFFFPSPERNQVSCGLSDVCDLCRGARDLMADVNWRLMKNDRIGLVGPNGAGKSTLLSAAAGRIDVRGKVVVKPGTSMGYLIQTAVSGSKRTAWEEASSQMHRVNRAER